MGVHSEFFEFETRGEFDVVNFTGRVEETVRRTGIVPVRGVQDL
jgi:thiamine phosphate synthase YjbQ (UPF0047 family)